MENLVLDVFSALFAVFAVRQIRLGLQNNNALATVPPAFLFFLVAVVVAVK